MELNRKPDVSGLAEDMTFHQGDGIRANEQEHSSSLVSPTSPLLPHLYRHGCLGPRFLVCLRLFQNCLSEVMYCKTLFLACFLLFFGFPRLLEEVLAFSIKAFLLSPCARALACSSRLTAFCKRAIPSSPSSGRKLRNLEQLSPLNLLWRSADRHLYSRGCRFHERYKSWAPM